MTDSAIEVVHDSRHLVVAVKPSGIVTTASSIGGDSLIRGLEDQLGAKLHATSRLDAEVSGLVTFARTKHGIAALTEARERGVYYRAYLGLVASIPDPSDGRWSASIAVDPKRRRLRMALRPGDDGEASKQALTLYAVRARAPGGVALRLEPRTGRTHQLRVHAADAGVPLLGDHRYGGAKRHVLDDGRVVRVLRVMLHCAHLRLPDGEGGMLDLEVEPPADLQRVWVSLGGAPAGIAPG